MINISNLERKCNPDEMSRVYLPCFRFLFEALMVSQNGILDHPGVLPTLGDQWNMSKQCEANDHSLGRPKGLYRYYLVTDEKAHC